MDAEFCIGALEDTMGRFGVPEIFNTDQDSQFTSPRSGLGGRTSDEAYHMIEPTPLPGLARATASSKLAA